MFRRDCKESIRIYGTEKCYTSYWVKQEGRMGHQFLKQIVEEVFLWVLEDNHRARKFYEKFGFLCTGDYIEDSIGEKELREVRYIYRFNNEKE